MDPADGASVTWENVPLTDTCAMGLDVGWRIASRYGMRHLSVGLVAIGLVADPASGAAQALGDGLERDALLEKLQSDILGSPLSQLETVLPRLVAESRSVYVARTSESMAESRARQPTTSVAGPRSGTAVADVRPESRQDGTESESRLRESAEAGDSDAMNHLGWLLSSRGDLVEAEQWYRRSAAAGHTLAMTNLGWLLEGRGIVDEAGQWYRKAADEGEPHAMNLLGGLLKKRDDIVEAEQWYRRSAGADHAFGMNNLADLLAGRGDFTEAESWYHRAAVVGSAYAMNRLARLLHDRVARQGMLQRWRHRTPNEADLAESEGWFRKAAAAGNVDAMAGLGALLEEGRNLPEAEWWYRKAIDAGDTSSMNNLGVLLLERNEFAEAEHWLRNAIAGGSTAAKVNLRRLLSRVEELTELGLIPRPARYPSPTRRHSPRQPVSSPTPRNVLQQVTSTPPDDYKILLGMVMGNHTTAEGLIAYEQRKTPTADRETLIRKAIERLREDRRRQG
ncbi:tetratricopeptide repeat protein [Nocardia sp. CA-135953]|uniref:tetratricopeptide repeat protein n=1 Tax=Nocardia sp. CA-135953 TaxID=3239978 RepID=UPI003D97342B